MIEIMVVLVVVGLLVSLVGLSMGGGGERRELEEHTRTLYLKMQGAAEQALVQNMEVGLGFEDNGYIFSVYNPDEDRWDALGGRYLRAGTFPAWMEVDLETEGSERDLPVGEDEDGELPDIVFFSSGEVTPFDLRLWYEQDEDRHHELISDGINPIEWLRPGEESDF